MLKKKKDFKKDPNFTLQGMRQRRKMKPKVYRRKKNHKY